MQAPLGSLRYLIRRTPDQMRPALRGDGETKDVHKAWLFDVSGINPDDITNENPGKIIAEKKVSLVKDAVSKLLGYGVEQFRQIVLLVWARMAAPLQVVSPASGCEQKPILKD